MLTNVSPAKNHSGDSSRSGIEIGNRRAASTIRRGAGDGKPDVIVPAAAEVGARATGSWAAVPLP
jgi:hypothetical protein